MSDQVRRVKAIDRKSHKSHIYYLYGKRRTRKEVHIKPNGASIQGQLETGTMHTQKDNTGTALKFFRKKYAGLPWSYVHKNATKENCSGYTRVTH